MYLQEVSVSTISNTALDRNFKKYDGIHRVTAVGGGFSFSSFSAEPVTEDNMMDLYKDDLLMSNRYKIFWAGNVGLYNLYYCSVTILLEMIESAKNKNPIVLINSTNMWTEREMSHFQFILKWLDSQNIEWKYFDNPPRDFYAKNFYKTQSEVIGTEHIDRLYKFSQNFIKDKTIEPFRKVYVSRRHIPSRNYYWIKPGLSTNKDDRINDHEVLESFLQDNGFEIIIPEQVFDNFEDQINYFNETKILVSLSSSGISNSLFMRPNTTVIEFMTTYPCAYGTRPLDENGKIIEDAQTDGFEGIHHLYHAQAYLKDSLYIAIPNRTRMSSDIINKIKNDKTLSNIFLKDGQ